MNEKTTKPDADLNARKMEFLDRLTDFAEQAGKRLIEKFPDKSFNKYKDFFEHGMRIRLYKKGKFVSLDWLKGYSGRGVKFDTYSLSGITVYYDGYPNILEKFVDVPFEEFTNAFDRLFAELLEEKQKDN